MRIRGIRNKGNRETINRQGARRVLALAFAVALFAVLSQGATTAHAAVGDQIDQFTVPVSGVDTYCSIGLAFDGDALYYDRCDDPNIYRIDTDGNLLAAFDTGLSELPNALAFDATRNGLWVGTQSCNAEGMPIYFWDFDDSSVTQRFVIPYSLINPATGGSFLSYCFDDGLAFNANDPADPSDDELWFSDDVNQNVGLFRPDGTFLNGYDATSVDASLVHASGLAIGGPNLYLGNNGGGDVFRADKATDPLVLVDQFTSGEERQEDMECDPVTFAPTQVMWVRTTPQGGAFADVVTAFEIESGTCGLGGGGAEICDDGIDNDEDGLVDNDDPDCQVCGDGDVDPGEECDDGNTDNLDGCSSDCKLENKPLDCSAAVPSASELWPPRHKFVKVNVVGVTDPDGDPVTITVTSIFQDEALDALGDGHTCPDGAGVGTDTALVRAERGKVRGARRNGRVYHVGFVASDGQGGECTATVRVCVPPNRGRGHLCVDEGPLFDSTGPCS